MFFCHLNIFIHFFQHNSKHFLQYRDKEKKEIKKEKIKLQKKVTDK